MFELSLTLKRLVKLHRPFANPFPKKNKLGNNNQGMPRALIKINTDKYAFQNLQEL